MKKLYVVVKIEKTADGETLQMVEVLESKPKQFSYIIFTE
jgi:hypothetical protein